MSERSRAGELAAALTEHPYESGNNNVCIHCGQIGSYAHTDEARDAFARAIDAALEKRFHGPVRGSRNPDWWTPERRADAVRFGRLGAAAAKARRSVLPSR